MITNKHREYEACENQFFIVAKSKEEMYKELDEYCANHKSEKVYIYEHNVRPSKENLRPEFMMDVEINPTGMIIFYRQYQ